MLNITKAQTICRNLINAQRIVSILQVKHENKTEKYAKPTNMFYSTNAQNEGESKDL